MAPDAGGNIAETPQSAFLSAKRDFYRACRENLTVPIIKLSVSVLAFGGGVFCAVNEGYALAGVMGVLSFVFAGSAVRTALDSGEFVIQAYDRMEAAKEKLPSPSSPS